MSSLIPAPPAAPQLEPGESLFAYRARTGITDPRQLFQAQLDYNRLAQNQPPPQPTRQAPPDYGKFNSVVQPLISKVVLPTLKAAQVEGTRKAFVGSNGNEVAYQTAKLSQDIINTVKKPISDAVNKFNPVAGKAFDTAADIEQGIYNSLGIPEDVSNQASAQRITDATIARAHEHENTIHALGGRLRRRGRGGALPGLPNGGLTPQQESIIAGLESRPDKFTPAYVARVKNLYMSGNQLNHDIWNGTVSGQPA